MNRRCTLATLFALSLIPVQAWASTPLERLDFASALPQDPHVSKARTYGLSSTVMRRLNSARTPNHIRIAIVDAIVRSGKTRNLSRLYVRYLEQQHKVTQGGLTISRLRTHEALTLAYMIARENPQKLQRLGGTSEVERASPLMLINTAVSRHRGDMTIALTSGVLKAHHAKTSPKDSLCTPHKCIDQALEPFGSTWSVPKAFVCQTLAMFPAPKKAKVTAHRDTCGTPDDKSRGLVVENAQPTTTPQHSRFSAPTPSSIKTPNSTPLTSILPRGTRIVRTPNGGLVLPKNLQLPPNMRAMLKLPANGRLTPKQSKAFLQELQRLQAQHIRMLQNRNSARNTRANPKILTLTPTKPKTLDIHKGKDTTKPTPKGMKVLTL